MFFINWNEQTKAEIDCQYRALHEIVRFDAFMTLKK
jgi:hypothetical protein